jgi:hypothetical protein
MKLHVKQLRDLHTSPDSCRAIKSGRIRLATYVVRMREKRLACRILVGNLDERDYLVDRGIVRIVTLKCVLTLILLTWRIW